MKLLTQWLGVLFLALLTVSCADKDYASSPLSPTTLGSGAPPSGPSPTLPVVTPLSVALSIGRSAPEVDDNISFVATTGFPITSAAWSFGDGATATTSTGSTAYAYPATGTFVARVIVTASDGRTASDQATVTVNRHTSPPRPTPTPTPGPNTSGFAVSLACSPEAAGTSTPCNVSTSYNGVQQPSAAVSNVDWDFGDGATASTGGPVTSHVYTGAGSYTVFATVTAMMPAPPIGSGGPETETVNTPVTIP